MLLVWESDGVWVNQDSRLKILISLGAQWAQSPGICWGVRWWVHPGPRVMTAMTAPAWLDISDISDWQLSIETSVRLSAGLGESSSDFNFFRKSFIKHHKQVFHLDHHQPTLSTITMSLILLFLDYFSLTKVVLMSWCKMMRWILPTWPHWDWQRGWIVAMALTIEMSPGQADSYRPVISLISSDSGTIL